MEASTAALVAGVLLLASTVQLSGVAAAPLGAPLGLAVVAPAPDASGPFSGAPSLELCAVSRPVHLVAGSAESSVQLQLSRPTAGIAGIGVDGQPRPCRVHVSAPASNLLSVELVPHPSAVDDDDDDLDDYDESSSSRSSSEAADDDVDAKGRDKVDRDADNGDVPSSSSTNAAAGNMGLLLAGLLQQDAARKGSSVNASCTLSLYVEGEVAWSVDLCDADAVLAAKNHIDNIPHNFSLVWTPPRPSSRRRLRAASILVSAARKGVPAENFCSVTTVRLAPYGLESAMALQLRAPEGSTAPCRVNIAAPITHVLSLLLVAAEASSTSSSSESAEGVKPSCGLSLLLGCTSEYWAADLCDAASAHQALNFTEVFPHNVTLVWTPPPASQRHHQLVQTVILTAIGKGKMCSQSQFFPCWRRPRAHPLCVSTELACDGYHNCPMDGNDEDPTVCRPNSKLIEVPGQEKENEGRSNPDAKSHIIEELLQSYYLKHHHASNHSRRNEEPPIQSSPDTLSNYGPWGYLMLGMLGCGALLMLCGLWECCCRQPKTTTASCPPSHTPTTVLMPPAGVLALDSDLEDDPSRPPAYDDLDPPPAYGALFPGQPKDDAPSSVPAPSSPTSLLADATFPHMDADDVPSLDADSGPS